MKRKLNNIIDMKIIYFFLLRILMLFLGHLYSEQVLKQNMHYVVVLIKNLYFEIIMSRQQPGLIGHSSVTYFSAKPV